MKIYQNVMVSCTIAIALLAASIVSAQDFPTKPIRLLTTTPGGANDHVARLVSTGVSENTRWSVVVENRPTALIAAETVSKGAPDGYALLVSTDNLWIGPYLQKVPYDPVRDFTPIARTTTAPNVLVVHPSLPVRNVKELIALAKARPGELNWGAGAIGSSTHLAGELFTYMTATKITFIPYKSSGTAMLSLVGGQIQLMFGSAGTATPYVKAGRLRLLGVSTSEPSTLVPGAPTIASAGVPGYEMGQVSGIFAAAGTPGPIINRLNQEILRALARPDIKEKFFNLGMDAAGSSPQEFASLIKADMARLGKMIKDANIKVE